jgi:hypothetical protein
MTRQDSPPSKRLVRHCSCTKFEKVAIWGRVGRERDFSVGSLHFPSMGNLGAKQPYYLVPEEIPHVHLPTVSLHMNGCGILQKGTIITLIHTACSGSCLRTPPEDPCKPRCVVRGALGHSLSEAHAKTQPRLRLVCSFRVDSFSRYCVSSCMVVRWLKAES